MKMRKASFVSVFVLFLVSLSCTSRAGAEEPVPHAYLPEISYEFRPVLDGESVLHDFIVLNTGKARLDILEVKPDCGCTTVSYSRHIPPGGRGTIAILLDTAGFGGEHLAKTISVRTNDPEKPAFNLLVTGDVLPLADIKPAEVKLTGTAGQVIRQTVTIATVPENPFKILEVRAEKGKDVRYELHELKSAGTGRYRLEVFNIKPVKGWYIDTLFLKTTSRRSPVLKIRVLGMIRESGAGASPGASFPVIEKTPLPLETRRIGSYR
jgi:hypothetical protein